uniref:LIM zinc-binding domain-containing protein n=1 Tax=Sus scrofa TaxID=9823 RepID=A0A8D1FG60_PIG
MNTSIPYQQNPYAPRGGSSVIQCYRCGDTCKGEVVRVHNNHFHIRCFTCQVCGCGLAQSGFFFKNQEYICTRDYQQLYGTRCDSCRDFITGEVISALGRTYHPKCFVCSLCRKPFPIGDKVTFSGKECLCQTCSQSMTSSKPIKIRGPSHCAGCKEEIKHGQSLLALDKQWHVSCFKCQTCSVILTGEYISKDGVPYCESDYHSQFGIKCETCDRYISGRVLEAGGKHYHPTCARCVRCHQMFTEGEEMYLTGKQAWPRAGKEARSPATAASALLARPQDGTSSPSPGGLGRLPLWLVGPFLLWQPKIPQCCHLSPRRRNPPELRTRSPELLSRGSCHPLRMPEQRLLGGAGEVTACQMLWPYSHLSVQSHGV